MNELQREELEVLESIYAELFKTKSSNEFLIIISQNPELKLQVQFIDESYPETPLSSFQLESRDIANLNGVQDACNQAAQQSAPAPAVFNLVEAAKDWLIQYEEEQKNHRTQLLTIQTTGQQKTSNIQDFTTKVQTNAFLLPQGNTPVNAVTFNQWADKFYQEKKTEEEKDLLKKWNTVCVNNLTYAEVASRICGKELFEQYKNSGKLLEDFVEGEEDIEEEIFEDEDLEEEEQEEQDINEDEEEKQEI